VGAPSPPAFSTLLVRRFPHRISVALRPPMNDKRIKSLIATLNDEVPRSASSASASTCSTPPLIRPASDTKAAVGLTTILNWLD
jgi:hypothetical protein